MSHVVEERRVRQTGTRVALVDNRDYAESEDGPWFLLCQEHGTLMFFESRERASWFQPSPVEWCEECRDAHPDA